MIQRLQEKRNEEGFTLIELLIVIIILGILAAIVVFAIGGTRGDAVASSCKTDAKSIQLSLEAQKTKSGKYPVAATATLNPTTAYGTTATANGALLRNWPGGTSKTADDYTFTYESAAGADYTVTVEGKSVQTGTFTDAADITAGNGCKKS